jgi:phosphoribosylaminoimidazole (AIR) synthetase
MTLFVAAEEADAVLRYIRGRKQKAWIIGEVIKGTKRVRME